MLHVSVYVLGILVTFINVSNIYLVTFRDLRKDYFVTSRFEHLMFLRNRDFRKQFVLRSTVRARVFNQRV